MACIHQQSQAVQTASGNGVTKAITPSSPGNIILAFASCNNTADAFTITDTAGNAWNILQAAATVGTNLQATWYTITKNMKPTTVQLSISPSNAFVCLILDEFSGQATSPIDNNTTASAGSGSPSVSLTPVANNCALWVATADTVTGVGAGFTKGGDDGAQDWSEFQILSGGGGSPQTCNFTSTSGVWNMAAVSIAPLILTAKVPPVVRGPMQKLVSTTTRYV